MRSPLALWLVFVAQAAHATPLDLDFAETTYFTNMGFMSVTGMAWAPDGSGRLFMTRKNGDVVIVRNGALNAAPFATMAPIYTGSECGLIGLAFDHDFVTNGYVYFFVTVSNNEQQIIRYTASGDSGTNRTVLVPGLDTVGANHDGGAVGIGADGKLYWAIGDNGNARGVNADLTRSASKIGRANLDGTPVLDNPFYDGAGPNNDYIWSRGYRNPFTFTFQARTGQLWVNNVGTSYETIQRPSAGDHAGWNAHEVDQPAGFIRPLIWYRTNGTRSRNIAAAPNGAVRRNDVTTIVTTGSDHYFHVGQRVNIIGVADASFNATSALITSLPTGLSFTIDQVGPDATSGGGTAESVNLGGSITGGTFWESSAVAPAYRGDYFFGDYNTGRIMRARLSPLNEVISVDIFGNAYTNSIDMDVGPDGALYHVQINGLVRRLAPVTPQPIIVAPSVRWLNEGGQGTFTVRLGAAPNANVTVDVARTAGDADVSVTAGAQLIFTPANFATPQVVTIAAAQDPDALNDSSTLTVTSAQLAASEPVDVTVIDNDVASLVLGATTLALTEGTSGSFTVALSAAPLAPVTVSAQRSMGDADITVSAGAMLTFDANNFATPQSVTIAAANDADNTDDLATIAVSGVGYETRLVTVTATDDDAAPPVITSAPVTTAVQGNAYRYDVAATGMGVTYALTTAPVGMTIDLTSGLITWTPLATGNFNVTVVAANGTPPDATQSWVVSVAADLAPTAALTRPVNGEIVSGTNAEFYGDGMDDVGTVSAQFSIDGVVRYTDVAIGDHFHIGGTHNAWDTTQLADGPHVVRMTVTDTSGQTGFAEVMVTVRNAVDAGVAGSPDAAPRADAGVGAPDAMVMNPDAAGPNDDAAAGPSDDAAASANDDAAAPARDAAAAPDATLVRADASVLADAGLVEGEGGSCDCSSSGKDGSAWIALLMIAAFVRSRRARSE